MTAFTAFAFASSPSTGATATRTMPDRLSEIKNVKDFGAVGDGATDDTAAIQAAVNWTSGANRGTIYFPALFYKVTSPITFNYNGNLSIRFLGEIGTLIFGSVNGYIFDRQFATATVTISNASPGVVADTAHGKSANDTVRFETTVIGGLPAPLAAGTTYYVKTVLSANTYTLSTTAGGTAINTTTAGSGTHTRGPINTPGGRIFERLNIQNSHNTGGCIRVGSTIGAVIRDSSLSGHTCITTEDAVGVSSRNTIIQNCFFSQAGTIAGSHYIIIGGGGVIENCTLSSTDTAVRAYGSGLYMSANRSENCNTSYLLGLDSGGNNIGLSGFAMHSLSCEGCLTAYDLAGLCNGFVISGSGHLGHDQGNSGFPNNAYPGSNYGIRIRADCARNGIIQGSFCANYHNNAAFSFADASSRANVVVRECNAAASAGGGVGWETPTNGYTAKFYNCNVNPLWTYAQRPTGGDVLEGDELDITDSNTATWGATVAGSGSNRIRMRYNGTNWTVVGK